MAVSQILAPLDVMHEKGSPARDRLHDETGRRLRKEFAEARIAQRIGQVAAAAAHHERRRGKPHGLELTLEEEFVV